MRNRFSKAYVGVIENDVMPYNIQDIFDMEGYLAIKVTPLKLTYVYWEKRNKGNLMKWLLIVMIGLINVFLRLGNGNLTWLMQIK